MRKIFIPLLLFFGFTLQATAQQPKDIMKDPIPVAMFHVTYAFHFPGLDNKTLYGVSHNVGGGFSFKTESNWLLTANANYIFGNKLNVDRLEVFGEGITNDYGEIIGGSGSFAMLELNQRGFHIQGEVGRLFPFGPNPNSGFLVQGVLGYLRTRIRTDYSDGDPDFEAAFYILKHTYCAAVLTENGFQDSELSLNFLQSNEGKRAIVALHVEGIIDYIKSR